MQTEPQNTLWERLLESVKRDVQKMTDLGKDGLRKGTENTWHCLQWHCILRWSWRSLKLFGPTSTELSQVTPFAYRYPIICLFHGCHHLSGWTIL